VLLLGHEMERAVTWNNPLSRPDKAFTKDVDRFTVRHRRATARDWRSYVRAAWRASVGVAMRLGDRFHHNPMVREALAARIVQSGVQKLVVDGDAVTAALQAALEHGSSRKEDVQALSRWAPTSPTAALQLLRSGQSERARGAPGNLEHAHLHDQGRDHRRTTESAARAAAIWRQQGRRGAGAV
jgi:hypothetical protein